MWRATQELSASSITRREVRACSVCKRLSNRGLGMLFRGGTGRPAPRIHPATRQFSLPSPALLLGRPLWPPEGAHSRRITHSGRRLCEGEEPPFVWRTHERPVCGRSQPRPSCSRGLQYRCAADGGAKSTSPLHRFAGAAIGTVDALRPAEPLGHDRRRARRARPKYSRRCSHLAAQLRRAVRGP